jgi:hypothetical protein
MPELADLRTAELTRDLWAVGAKRLGKGVAVKRHGTLAVANEHLLAVDLHARAPLRIWQQSCNKWSLSRSTVTHE